MLNNSVTESEFLIVHFIPETDIEQRIMIIHLSSNKESRSTHRYAKRSAKSSSNAD